MALRTNTVDASALAERHGRAVVARENAIMRANAKYEAERKHVIEVGTQRVAQIQVLQSELEKERAAINDALQGVQV